MTNNSLIAAGAKMMLIKIPEFCLVLLVGTSSSGKSTFAKQHFRPTEIVSSDHCRALLADDENNQVVTGDAFELVHFIVAKRLKLGLLTVVDATNIQPEARKPLLALARHYHCPAIALVFDIPETVCKAWHALRSDRPFGEYVIEIHRAQMEASLSLLEREGFRQVTVFKSPEELHTIKIERQRSRSNKQHEQGPFDIIGDIHGCFDELMELLKHLGYQIGDDSYPLMHPEGRKVIFLGDLVDRGPRSPEVVRFVMGCVRAGKGFCVAGNHDVKLVRALRGHSVSMSNGLKESMEQFSQMSEDFIQDVAEFLNKLASHYVFDQGNLVVAHAGLKEDMHGRGSGKVREFALYGDTNGEKDEFGLPVRLNWAANYHGKAIVVYGHTPVQYAQWFNNTICIDTGCVFGGRLTALRYPEKELVSVPAYQKYYEPPKPLARPECALTTPPNIYEVLDSTQTLSEGQVPAGKMEEQS